MEQTLRFRVNEPAVVAEMIDGEVVVIHMEKGIYHSLAETAAYLWEAFSCGVPLGECVEGLQHNYLECPAGLFDEVRKFAQSLVDLELLQHMEPRALSRNPQPTRETRANYSTPVISTYEDMQDLLLADPIHDFEGKPWPGLAG